MLLTKGLAKYRHTEVIFSICNSVMHWFEAGHYLFSFLLLSSSSVFQSVSVPDLTSIYSRTSPSLDVEPTSPSATSPRSQFLQHTYIVFLNFKSWKKNLSQFAINAWQRMEKITVAMDIPPHPPKVKTPWTVRLFEKFGIKHTTCSHCKKKAWNWYGLITPVRLIRKKMVAVRF